MAIYHNTMKIVTRGKGKSAVAASAYQSGTKMKLLRTIRDGSAAMEIVSSGSGRIANTLRRSGSR